MHPVQPKNGFGQPASILVVDDTAANLQVLAGMLRDRGYKVRPVPGGKLALQAAQRDPPDLILLDTMMPEMNGYEVCERLKADEKLKGVPVIFISALTEQLDKVQAFAIGGVDYLTKPFHMEELYARVETHLNLRRLQIGLEATNLQLQAANTNLLALQLSLAERVAELEKAAVTIKQLDDLLPMCAWCKKVRDDHDYWQELEKFVTLRFDGRITHGICPHCMEKVSATSH
jgi:DNA-binding response OmpR family regulator